MCLSMNWGVTLIASLVPLVSAACVPDVPQKLLHDPSVLKHPAVISAFQSIEVILDDLFTNKTRDGLSLAIAHASSPESVFSYQHGNLKMNETQSYGKRSSITSDSIFRINSVSKSFTVFSALMVENLAKSRDDNFLVDFSLDSPVRSFLPQFKLSEKDWNDGGREITLRMLASHVSGLPREGYSTGFNMIAASGKADAVTIGNQWASATPESVLEHVARTNLMFAPGARAGYSNAGMSILATAIVNHYNNITSSELNWSELAMQQIFCPLNMTSSFFGPVPDKLRDRIGIAGGENWADLVVGLGYDPAAGMWSSANDLTKYLHHIWLRPDPPSLISLHQRRRSLQPTLALPDGKQLVGPGWEIDLFDVSTFNVTSGNNKTYATYGKSGDGGGWHSWIDVVPNLGYGLVVLSQVSGLANYSLISPTALKTTAQQQLLPAFAEALSFHMEARYAGWYGNGRDAGAVADEVKRNDTNSTTYARIEVQDQILYLRELYVNGTNALEGIDRLSWTEGFQGRYFSSPAGVALMPAEGAGENADFGPGAQVWRFMIPGLDVCDWFDFDGYADNNAWPLEKLVLVEIENVVELHYPPFDIILSRLEA